LSNTSTASSSGGIGFAGLLTILFIALKLTGVITWSWVWVLSPLWIGFVLFLGFLLLALIMALVFSNTPLKRTYRSHR